VVQAAEDRNVHGAKAGATSLDTHDVPTTAADFGDVEALTADDSLPGGQREVPGTTTTLLRPASVVGKSRGPRSGDDAGAAACPAVIAPTLMLSAGDSLMSGAKLGDDGEATPHGVSWLNSANDVSEGKLTGVLAMPDATGSAAPGAVALVFRPTGSQHSDVTLHLTGSLMSWSSEGEVALYQFSGLATEERGTCAATVAPTPFTATLAVHQDDRAPSVLVQFADAGANA